MLSCRTLGHFPQSEGITRLKPNLAPDTPSSKKYYLSSKDWLSFILALFFIIAYTCELSHMFLNSNVVDPDELEDGDQKEGTTKKKNDKSEKSKDEPKDYMEPITMTKNFFIRNYNTLFVMRYYCMMII